MPVTDLESSHMPQPVLHARNVVLGAGAMGSAAAYHLARRGEPVVLVEQFVIGHNRGSSHGAARITRHSYADISYARLMPEAFRAWRVLEADAGQNVYLRTGGISLCPAGVDYVAQVSASLRDIGVLHRRMTGRAVREVLPAFGVPDDTDAVFEPDAGVLAAARIVVLQVTLARQLGGERTTLLENRPVIRLDLETERPTLITDAGPIVTDKLIVTAGPWTSRLVPRLKGILETTRQRVLYFRPPDPLAFAPGRFPVFIYKGRTDQGDYYGMPAVEGLGVKVARHGGPDTDPDQPDHDVDESYRSEVRQFLGGCIPTLASAPIDTTEVCIYTVAPNDRFHIGPLPGRSDVIVASPCSGHGFKFSCLVGRVLADLATFGETDISIDQWRLL
jgi:sarcosine oxidase